MYYPSTKAVSFADLAGKLKDVLSAHRAEINAMSDAQYREYKARRSARFAIENGEAHDGAPRS